MRICIVAGVALAALYASPQDSVAQAVRVQVASRLGKAENRWRYEWHNDRWWYWSQDEHWSYFNRQRWVRYDPRRPSTGGLTAGYRKAPAFESPPAAPPQPPRTWSAQAVEREAGLTNSYYLGGGKTTAAGTSLGGDPLPVLSGPSSTPDGASSPGGIGRRFGGRAETTAPIDAGRGRTGGGAFGGPKGSSLGAGSVTGGASSPQ